MLIRLACAKAKKIGYLSSRTLRSVRLCHSEENGSDRAMPSEPCLFRFARSSSVKASCHLVAPDPPERFGAKHVAQRRYLLAQPWALRVFLSLSLIHLGAPQGAKLPFL